jgi:16S rRNA (cytosine967-C5)-methyltransferase
VLRRTFEEGAYTDRALTAEARRLQLDGRERALAKRLAFGAVQRRATLDHVIALLAGRPAERLDAPVLAALRLGVYELAFLEGAAGHAAVDQAVELVKEAGAPRASGIVNAVLRRGSREARALVDALPDATPGQAAIRHSHPEWVARTWWDALGPGEARALMAADNEPGENAIRVNTLRADPATVAAALDARPAAAAAAEPGPTNLSGPTAAPGPPLPEGLLLAGPVDLAGSDLFAAGAITPQSRASMAVARILDPQPGERVLDLCAAPGAKATHLAALMRDEGEITAVERNPARAAELRANAARLGATAVHVIEGDARDDHGRGFDRVLVDPPCTGLGTLRGRPDLRWRATPESAAELARLQGEILAAGANALKPGGTLVYSTCTIDPPENEELVAAFLAPRPDFQAEDLQIDHPLWKHPTVPLHLLPLPHRNGTDGFFVARLRRDA